MVTHLTKIGNSFGVILNKKILQQAGVITSKEVTIEVKEGVIIIAPVSKDIPLNLDRSSWDAQFKKAIKAGHKADKSVWPDDISAEADKDWNW
jgi:antitoxin component of MazEF toxin-antitoxin module